MNDLDIVAGIIKQLVGAGLLMREEGLDQGKVAGIQPPQQVVERPIAAVSPFSLSRRHPEMSSSVLPRQ
jgi:hypothetical protein